MSQSMQKQQNLNQSAMSSFKTNQNLERLGKISERLNNIHLNIEKDKYSKNGKSKLELRTWMRK